MTHPMGSPASTAAVHSVAAAADGMEAVALAALDGAALRNELAEHYRTDLEPAGLSLAEVVPLRVTYLPGKEITVLYEVGFGGGNGAPSSHQWISGRYVTPERMPKLAVKSKRRHRIQPKVGPPTMAVAGLSLLLYAFPNDAKLDLGTDERALAQLEQQLPDILPRLGVADHRRRVKLNRSPVRYTPTRHCLWRFDVRLADHGGPENSLDFYGKTFRREGEADKTCREQTSFQRMARLPNGLRVNEPLGVIGPANTLLTSTISGDNLLSVVAERDLASTSQTLAEGLAALHGSGVLLEKDHTLHDEQGDLETAYIHLKSAFPELRDRLNEVYFTLRRTATELPALLRKPLHGTYRLNHVLCEGAICTLIDFESCRMGDPAYDVANFVSSLYYQELQGALSAAQRAEIQSNFVNAYGRIVPQWEDRRAVYRWFLGSLLVRKQAFKYLKHLHPDRAGKICRVLEIASSVVYPS